MGLNSLTIADWISFRKLEKSEGTVVNDKAYAAHYLAWANANEVLIPMAAQGDLDAYFETFKSDMSPDRAAKQVSFLRNLYGYLYKAHRRAYRNPTVGWHPNVTGLQTGARGATRTTEREIAILTVGQVQSLLRKAENEIGVLSGDRLAVQLRRIALAELIYSTGMTLTEAAALKRHQFNGIYRRYIEIGSQKSLRAVPLTEPAFASTRRWLTVAEDRFNDDDAVFINITSGASLSANSLSTDLRLWGRYIHTSKNPELNATSLRNSFVAHLLANKAEPGLLAYVLGASSMDLVSRIREAVQRGGANQAA